MKIFQIGLTLLILLLASAATTYAWSDWLTLTSIRQVKYKFSVLPQKNWPDRG